ncbi:MAG: VenA family class IV lanthipeptide [Actinomycetota bacterium]|nr:VenA family class IV lanthipeptide [Actinomycetota bacterium]
MEFASLDLVASLQALPESDPIKVDGIQFGGKGGGDDTCEQACIGVLTIQVNTVCVQFTCT